MQSYLEDRAAYKLADTADQFIAGLYTGVAYANVLQVSGTPSTTAGAARSPRPFTAAPRPTRPTST